MVFMMFRMMESPFKLPVGKGFKKEIPSLMRAFEHSHSRLYGDSRAVLKFGPSGFIIRFYGRIIFRKRQFEADKAVGMAVCKVVNQLPHRPAPRPVLGIQLFIAEILNQVFQPAGKIFDYPDMLLQFCI